jgi:Tol biopolymer transport system component
MSLSPGTRLGPYEIVAPIGAGGMGEVYKANDTRLDRIVALKVLPEALAADPEFCERFTREAKSISALSHPNICTLFDVGSRSFAEGAGGPHVDYLVMEYLEGETLAARLERGALSLADALRIATEIASALDKAHRQGIVHRDLKPGNIMLVKSGGARSDQTQAKLLDFGLAKIGPAATLSGVAPTGLVTSPRPAGQPLTAQGTILGTFQYMAPEQIDGEEADARTDIFAFGAVLFEMLTGRRAFAGKSQASLLGAILKEQPPPVSQVAPVAPPALDHVVGVCLAKDPDARFQTAHDLLLQLKWIAKGGGAAVAPTPAVAAPPWRRALPWALVAASLLTALATVLMRDRTAPAALTRLQIALPPSIELATSGAFSVCLSPDGSSLAFVGIREGIRQVFQRRLDQDRIAPVPGTENAFSCAFSPNGRELLVGLGDSSLQRMGLFDGKTEPVAPSTSSYMGAWLPNGRVVFAKDGRLWMSGATPGAAPTQLTSARAGSTAVEMHPVPVPGGKAVLFVSANPETPDSGRIEAVSLADKVRTRIVDRASSPVLTRTRHLLFLRDGVLLAAPFDEQSLKTTGDATPVLSDVRVVRTYGTSFGTMTLSDTGVLAYVSTSTVQSEIVSMSRTREEKILLSNLRPAANPRLSTDGRWLVLDEVGAGLRVWDLENRTSTGLAEGWTFYPIFARGGKDVIFGLSSGLFRQPRDGSARPVQIAGSDARESPTGLTPDGADVLFGKITDTTSADIYALPLAGGKERALVSTAAYEGGAQISPDENWMVYVSNELGGGFGGFEIFVLRYPALDIVHRRKVSSGGGTQPVWNPKGGELFYRNGNRMMSVRLTGTPERPDFTLPEELFSGFYAFGGANTIPNYSMTKDGDHFILVKQSGASVNVVLNWFETLKRLK